MARELQSKYIALWLCILVIALVVVAFAVNSYAKNNLCVNNQYMVSHHLEQRAALPQLFITSATVHSKTNNAQYPYLALMNEIINQLNLAGKNVLVIGDGGYKLGHDNKENIHFTYLNFTSNQLPNACDYLNLIAAGDHILAVGKNPLEHSPQLYNAIVSNIFPNNFPIPTELLSYHNLIEMRNALTADGNAIFNVVARPTLSDPYSKRVDNTIHAVFTSCMKIPLIYADQATNIIYVCHKSKEDADYNVF